MNEQKQPVFSIQNSVSADNVSQGIHHLQRNGALSILVICSTDKALDVHAFNQVLTTCSLPIFGGVFPEFHYDGTRYKEAMLLVGLPVELTGITVPNISTLSTHLDASNDEKPLSKLIAYRNFLLILDGLSPANEAFIDLAYESIGSGNHYIGGGAGYLDLTQRPCILSNEGLLEDAALLIGLPWDLTLAMSHGWEILNGPYLATETDGCEIHTINYQPALTAYREALIQEGKNHFEDDDFFRVSSHHPFGLPGIDNEIIIRDPISTANGSITCVGEVLPNSMIYIMKGDNKTLIESAKRAMISSNKDTDYALVFDCISRVLFLGDDIDKELAAIKAELPDHAVSFGAFSLGEIITGKSGSINWLNKSTSIAKFSTS